MQTRSRTSFSFGDSDDKTSFKMESHMISKYARDDGLPQMFGLSRASTSPEKEEHSSNGYFCAACNAFYARLDIRIHRKTQ